MQIDFLLSTEQEKLNGCHMGPRTLHLGMQHEKILAHLKMDIAVINSKEFVSVTKNNKTNPKCREDVRCIKIFELTQNVIVTYEFVGRYGKTMSNSQVFFWP